MSEPLRCQMTIYVPEQLRRTGRGPSGFQRHFTERQCSRAGKYGGYCATHAPFPLSGVRHRVGQPGWHTTHDGRYTITREWPGYPWLIYDTIAKVDVVIGGVREFATLFEACMALASYAP